MDADVPKQEVFFTAEDGAQLQRRVRLLYAVVVILWALLLGPVLYMTLVPARATPCAWPDWLFTQSTVDSLNSATESLVRLVIDILRMVTGRLEEHLHAANAGLPK